MGDLDVDLGTCICSLLGPTGLFPAFAQHASSKGRRPHSVYWSGELSLLDRCFVTFGASFRGVGVGFGSYLGADPFDISDQRPAQRTVKKLPIVSLFFKRRNENCKDA